MFSYPIYFAFHFNLPWHRNANLPRIIHNPPSIINGHYYSQRYTGVEWGPIRVGVVWQNPKPKHGL